MDRNEEKIQAVIDRLGYYDPKFPKCDYCHKERGTQYHERIARSLTVGNKEARELSYARQLCNLLCSTCHNRADSTEVDDALWEFAIKLHTLSEVRKAVEAVQAAMRSPIIVEQLR